MEGSTVDGFIQRSIWDAAREGFLMEQTEGARKGSSVVDMGVRSKAVTGPREMRSGSQEQFVFLTVEQCRGE